MTWAFTPGGRYVFEGDHAVVDLIRGTKTREEGDEVGHLVAAAPAMATALAYAHPILKSVLDFATEAVRDAHRRGVAASDELFAAKIDLAEAVAIVELAIERAEGKL